MIRNRPMTRGELDLVLTWAAEEGWNPGLNDADAFWASDPDGFFIAEAEGTRVAAISVVNHSDTFAFLGLYICRPSHRGRGVGLALWRHALAHAGDRTIGLDGVAAQQANYAASGFTRAGATQRFTGIIRPARAANVRPARPEDASALAALEAAASGWAKPRYMTQWFTGSATRMTHVIEAEGAPVAAATLRRCRDGTKIGPILARNADEAWALVADAATTAEGPITIDVPDQATAMAARCRAAGLEMGFETARMYRGPAPRLPTGAVTLHGVSSLELG